MINEDDGVTLHDDDEKQKPNPKLAELNKAQLKMLQRAVDETDVGADNAGDLTAIQALLDLEYVEALWDSPNRYQATAAGRILAAQIS